MYGNPSPAKIILQISIQNLPCTGLASHPYCLPNKWITVSSILYYILHCCTIFDLWKSQSGNDVGHGVRKVENLLKITHCRIKVSLRDSFSMVWYGRIITSKLSLTWRVRKHVTSQRYLSMCKG
jgi:hypothetical protein